MELNEIMNRYMTDKREQIHNYVKFYEHYFKNIRNDSLKFLEIGIYRPPVGSMAAVGASLQTWRDYFPNSIIYGADLSRFEDIEEERIKTTVANQEIRNGDFSLESIVQNFGGDFDVIIDDGGHTMKQQQITLGFMFKHLKSGGIFIIEDLHTSYMPQYNPTRTNNTTLNMLQNYIETKKMISEFMTVEEMDYLNNNIGELILHKGNESEIVFIIKK